MMIALVAPANALETINGFEITRVSAEFNIAAMN